MEDCRAYHPGRNALPWSIYPSQLHRVRYCAAAHHLECARAGCISICLFHLCYGCSLSLGTGSILIRFPSIWASTHCSLEIKTVIRVHTSTVIFPDALSIVARPRKRKLKQPGSKEPSSPSPIWAYALATDPLLFSLTRPNGCFLVAGRKNAKRGYGSCVPASRKNAL